MGWEPLKPCSKCEQIFSYGELVYWVGEEYLCDICHDEAVEKIREGKEKDERAKA